MTGESSSGRAAEIAKSVFIEDVDAYMQGKQVENVLVELQERLRRLRGYEAQASNPGGLVLQNRKRLLEKLPEIKKSLEAVGALLAKKDSGDVISADFELTDGIYAKAHLQVGRVRRERPAGRSTLVVERGQHDVESVGLWLGAGVMCEYPLEEAQALLEANKAACEANLGTAVDNLGLLKDSITVTEVNTARVFNWDVERRRGLKGGER
ncbi:Prefoldin subunit 3 [Monoraphidium neglectum]|uniref:Prefoldin subunit 3 n=1 Tax=Monoraphidium neglectum TaxID=145388 RepID=A0A0D2MHD7_9CHLO|nr:Prefoldin subunit 3 [Monoraphidium neglectum]KIZ02490.1 Prefoldin subunit 3 [Monoraphidium neglectum]|eukprot:XP_013901509.1 Prefoldin subunit 3 [Monoraphidium neglectum]